MKSTTIPLTDRTRATQDLLVLMYQAEVNKGGFVDESALAEMKRSLTKWYVFPRPRPPPPRTNPKHRELETLQSAKRHNLNAYWEQHQQRRQQFLQLSPRLLPAESRVSSFCEDEDEHHQQQQQHEPMMFDPHEEDLLLRHHQLTNQTLCDDLTAIFHNHQGMQNYW